MHTYMHVYMYLSICLVPPQNPPFLHFCNFSCHFWLPSKYLELAINCMCRIEDWRLKILRKTSSIQVWIEDWRLKILRKTSSIQVWIEDWRLKILRKTSSIQVWIFNPRLKIEEVSQKNFFKGLASHLQSRIGLKKFFWESSIFNPDLDWRSFSENLQSSIFNPIHFAINCNQLQILGTSKATKNDKTNDARKI